jgi:hypothetical protein
VTSSPPVATNVRLTTLCAVELKEVFTGRWLVLMIAVPAITALMAAFFFLDAADEEFQATAVLSVREFVAVDASGDIRSVIDNFESALGGRQVAEAVASAEGLDSANSQIEVAVLGAGGDVQVSYVATSAEAASEALETGVREALRIVSEVERRRLARQITAAENLSQESIERLLEIEALAGSAGLDDEIARRSADILALRNQIAAAGDSTLGVSLTAILVEKEEELTAIEEQLLPWTDVRARLDRAVSSTADNSLRLQQILVSQEALRDEGIIQSERIDELSKLPGLLRVVVGAAVATALVILIVARIPALRSGGRLTAPGAPRKPLRRVGEGGPSEAEPSAPDPPPLRR